MVTSEISTSSEHEAEGRRIVSQRLYSLLDGIDEDDWESQVTGMLALVVYRCRVSPKLVRYLNCDEVIASETAGGYQVVARVHQRRCEANRYKGATIVLPDDVQWQMGRYLRFWSWGGRPEGAPLFAAPDRQRVSAEVVSARWKRAQVGCAREYLLHELATWTQPGRRGADAAAEEQ